MIRSAVSKVMWVGRATVFLVGLAVILALVFGVATTALGANGKPFLLGKKNVASAISTLVKQGTGPALKLQVGAGQPPMAVSSATKVARLNADRIDDREASSFANGVGGVATNADKLDGQDASEFAADANQNGKADAAEHADNATNAGNADTVDGKHAADFAAATHAHDDRYYTETESDGRYLFKGQKAADSDKLDGIDSAHFVKGTGRAQDGAVDISPGDTQFVLVHTASPAVEVTYTCPTDLATNGTLKLKNRGTEQLDLFSDNGGENPNIYGRPTGGNSFPQQAASGGEHITLQVQGAGVGTIEVFSAHRTSDSKCHVQAQGLFTQ